MIYSSITEKAKAWKISEQMVRRYCRDGRIPDCIYEEGIWYIPEDSKKPGRKTVVPEEQPVLDLALTLQKQKKKKSFHGLYDYTLVNFTYSSSRLASNRLTKEQVESLFSTGKISVGFEPLKVSDCIEAINHMLCIDYIIDQAAEPLTQKFIKKLHSILMTGTVDANMQHIVPGEYRPQSFTIEGRYLPPAISISPKLNVLIKKYEDHIKISLSNILSFHVDFENLSPFQDGNGRVGRLIMFKECLRHNIVPFIIDDKSRHSYLNGICKWKSYKKAFTNMITKCQARFAKEIEHQNRLKYLDPPVSSHH